SRFLTAVEGSQPFRLQVDLLAFAQAFAGELIPGQLDLHGAAAVDAFQFDANDGSERADVVDPGGDGAGAVVPEDFDVMGTYVKNGGFRLFRAIGRIRIGLADADMAVVNAPVEQVDVAQKL